MSGEINNREYRQQVIRELISQLHAGKSVDEVKHRFEETFTGVSAAEIADAEQALIAQGMPVEEVQRLCDVHAAVFRGSVEEIHAQTAPNHPAEVFRRENRAIEEVIEQEVRPFLADFPLEGTEVLAAAMERLWQIDRHYLKKENLWFPFMERYGITAPPKVMWGVDDEIRTQIKEIRTELQQGVADAKALVRKVQSVLDKITEMIFKEESIMMPMLTDLLTPEEWKQMEQGSGEIGACLVEEPAAWSPAEEQRPAAPENRQQGAGEVVFPTGALRTEQLCQILDTLPVDITFVDRDDVVRYFSQGGERIFPRTKAVIGRNVSNCHPPASVHIVEQLVADFKSGKKDREDFWIHMGEKYVLIRYSAVRGKDGEYLGVLEVTQDIAPIQAITGEKRLMEPEQTK